MWLRLPLRAATSARPATDPRRPPVPILPDDCLFFGMIACRIRRICDIADGGMAIKSTAVLQ
jgi:hypothetical protein